MQGLFDLKPRLSHLATIFDLPAVSRMFQRLLPKNASIRARRLEDVKYYPAFCCTATYALTMSRQDALPLDTIGQVQVDASGWTPRFYDADPQMPWLALATEHSFVRERLAGLVSNGGASKVHVTPIRYKPGAHAVIRYDLTLPSETQTFFGKVFANDGEPLLKMVRALYQASEEREQMPRIAQPLAYWSDLHMLVQHAVRDGVELNALLFQGSEENSGRVEWVRAAAACISALHAGALVDAPRRVLLDDVGELYGYLSAIAMLAPEQIMPFKKTIREIANRALKCDEPVPVPSHGALRTDQFMVAENKWVLMDLDGVCWANPARDVANLLAYLQWKALRQPQHAEFITRARQVFLEGYASEGSKLDEGWLALYEAVSMLKITGRRFRNLNFQEWHLIPQLLSAVQALLD